MSISFSRRSLLKSAGLGVAGLATGFWGYRQLLGPTRYPFTGQMVGANSKVGHLLREKLNLQPSEIKKIDTVIVGGGVAGLSAAWWFKKNNFKDYLLFELDSEVGGNSRSGGNSISQYPWGAHYVPLPGPQAHYVRELFSEIGVIQGYENQLPIYNDFYLCADAHERLFFQGGWQEGLVPQHGISGDDKRQYEEFFSYVEALKLKKGRDGKTIFSIPLETSSQDSEYLKLDQVSMADFMTEKQWNSRYLNWYVNYCCRDDYGMPHTKVSAWAGLHYFASRAGQGANADSSAVLTWPEGNGFLIQKLKELVGGQILTNSLVFAIESSTAGNQVDVIETTTGTCTRYQAKNVIFCGPRYTAAKIIKGYETATSLDYAPWLVANISLREKPDSHGAPLSWDNVSFYSKSLGYILANQQDIKVNHKPAVVTYYLPLDEQTPQNERKMASQKNYHDWLTVVVPDLEKMHPGITKLITNIDLWVWGHGMVSPGIGYLWSQKRQDFLKPFHSVEFAHSDMSGISIFEEAQFRGVEAAKRILRKGTA